MAKKAPYGKLHIIQDQLDAAVLAFFSTKDGAYTLDDIKLINGSRNRLEFTYLEKNYTIDFHYNNDGTTTIDLTPGGQDPLKTEMAEFIKDSHICTVEEIKGFKNPWFTFKDINYEDFIEVVSLMKDEDGVSETCHRTDDIREIWTLESDKKEKVTITFFKTSNKAMVQGKPLSLFSKLYTSLIMLLDIEKVPEIMNQHLTVAKQISKKEIVLELEYYLPNCFDQIHQMMRPLCYQSIFNLKIHDEMFDYGFLSFPAFKLLEGHLKYIMDDKSIPLNNDRFSMFTKIKDPNNSGNELRVIHPDHNSKFTVKQKQAVNRAYTFYANQRNNMMHWGDIANKPIKGKSSIKIYDRIDEVHGIIIDVLSIINSYYIG